MADILGFVQKHLRFKLLIVSIIVAIGLLVSLLIPESNFLNFFFFPVILAGYFLSTRGGVGTAVGSLFLVGLILYNKGPEYLHPGAVLWNYVSWSCILILAGYMTGKLSDRSNRLYQDVIAALATSVGSEHPDLHAHCLRVSSMAVEIATEMNLGSEDKRQIALAGMLHDFGKVALHAEFLDKEGILTEEERLHVQEHTEIAANVLGPIEMLADVLPLVRYHHENINGEGYYHKTQKEIPLGSRIIAVADVFDAMTSERPYRKAMGKEAVIEKIEAESGKKFDPVVVEAFLKIKRDEKKDQT